MRVLRRTGDDLKWSAKLMVEWDEDDKYHKGAIRWMLADMHNLAVARDYYIDRETLLKMYDQYMAYNSNTARPIWEQERQALHEKLKEQA